MKQQRYAIWFDLTGSVYERHRNVIKYWHCQGLPRDQTDFGFAILYPSPEHAKKAISKTFAKSFGACAKLVPVTCEFSIDQ